MVGDPLIPNVNWVTIKDIKWLNLQVVHYIFTILF